MEIALCVHVGFGVFCQISQDVLNRFPQSFHQMKAFRVQMIAVDLFFDISKDVAIATDFVKKWHTPHIRRSGIQKRNRITYQTFKNELCQLWSYLDLYLIFQFAKGRSHGSQITFREMTKWWRRTAPAFDALAFWKRIGISLYVCVH